MGEEQGTSWLDVQRTVFEKFDVLSKVREGPAGKPLAPGEYVRSMLGEPIQMAHKHKFASEEDIQIALRELNAMLEEAGFSPVSLED